MTTTRVLQFRVPQFRKPSGADGREPASPFRHLMPEQPLTARQLLHRQRMILAMQIGGRQRLVPFQR